MKPKFIDINGDKYRTRISGASSIYAAIVRECFSEATVKYNGNPYNKLNGVMMIVLAPIFFPCAYIQTFQSLTDFELKMISKQALEDRI